MRKLCIFCNEKPANSKEHVWADWLRNYIPRTSKKNMHFVTTNGSKPSKGTLYRSGDPHSQTLKVACQTCNNGWMSELQNKSKPLISALIQDNWLTFNEKDLETISAWAFMFTIVAEQANRAVAASSLAHRRYIYENRQCHPDWVVLIGRCVPSSETHGFFNIINFSFALSPDGPPLIHETATFTLGKLIVHVAIIPQTVVNPNGFDKTDFALRHWLRVISPNSTSDFVTKPEVAHHGPSCERISEETAVRHGYKTFNYTAVTNTISVIK